MSCEQCGKDADSECSKCSRSFCSEDCFYVEHKYGKCQYFGDIENETLKNNETGPIIIYEDPSGRIQIGLSAINPGKMLDWEVHKHMSQFGRVEQGYGILYVENLTGQKLKPGAAFMIPSGMRHKIVCEDVTLKFYTIYSKNTDDKWEH
jgi:quercetin dioxygenase-like cupin family protein